MRRSTKLLSRSEAADIYFDWYSEQEIEKAFGAGSQAQKTWDDYLLNEFRPYLPKVTGMLEFSGNFATSIGSGEIIYKTPYAKFLYYGKVMVDKETGSPWAQPGGTKIVTNRRLMYSTVENVLAGSFWDTRARNDRLPLWTKKLKEILTKEFNGG